MGSAGGAGYSAICTTTTTTTTTSSTENGDVQAAGGEAVTAGVAFVPEVMYDGQWSPICGHYFWNNNNGAATVCKALGFSGGTQQQTRRAYSTDSMPVGSCNAGESLTSCTAGGNGWGKFEYQNGWCKAGTSVSITVTCGAKIEDESTEAPTGYTETVVGEACPAGTTISSKAECEAAASAIGHDQTTVNWEGAYPHIPAGCDAQPTHLIWSTGTRTTGGAGYSAICSSSTTTTTTTSSTENGDV